MRTCKAAKRAVLLGSVLCCTPWASVQRVLVLAPFSCKSLTDIGTKYVSSLSFRGGTNAYLAQCNFSLVITAFEIFNVTML
jgi:hypothetical protein